MLTTSDRNELEYITKPVVVAKGATSHVKLNQLDVSQGFKVPVVNKFSDVFFKELSVMPPDHDIVYVVKQYLELLLHIRDPIGSLLSN
jgi:hypothetical protein